MISFVIPAYNEEKNLERCIVALEALCLDIKSEYEIIFIDDGSKDNTINVFNALKNKHQGLSLYSFSRNFGKEAAIFCGLKQANGDCVVVMDADLQHPVATVKEMYEAWLKGYQVIEGVKKKRQNENFIKRLFANSFYALMEKSTHLKLKNASDFKLLDRKVVDALNALDEKQTFFRALSGWVGFKSTYIEFTVGERIAGDSKWSINALLNYALNNLTSFSSVPMQFVTACGIIFLLFSIVLGVNTLYNFFNKQALEGFTTVILILLIMGSIIMISLGIIGFYLAKIYEELKGRPRYIVSNEFHSRKD